MDQEQPQDRDALVEQDFGWLPYNLRNFWYEGIKIAGVVTIQSWVAFPILLWILVFALWRGDYIFPDASFWTMLMALLVVLIGSAGVSILIQMDVFWKPFAWLGIPLAYRRLGVEPNEDPLMLDGTKFICRVLISFAAAILYFWPQRIVNYYAGAMTIGWYYPTNFIAAYLISLGLDRVALFHKGRLWIALTVGIWFAFAVTIFLWIDETTNKVLCPSILWYCKDV